MIKEKTSSTIERANEKRGRGGEKESLRGAMDFRWKPF